jgi:hypothetical protein
MMPHVLPIPGSPLDIPMLPTRVADANAISAAVRQHDLYEYIVAMSPR